MGPTLNELLKAKKRPFVFDKQQGLKVAISQIAYWASKIEDSRDCDKFLEAASKLVIESYDTAKSGLDVKRGTDLEILFYRIGIGWTDEQYWEYVKALD